jgi:hypothetical protein
LVRQALKGVTAASASVSTYLLTKGADAELVHSAAAGLIAAASWSLETGLSFVARKYTVN